MQTNDVKNTNGPIEIEFGDESTSMRQKSAPIQKLYDPKSRLFPQQPKTRSCSYNLEGGILINCKIDEWGTKFTLFGEFLQDAKNYYKKTCINADYVYYFSYRPMYRELTHEQLCWYLFWRSKVREGTYPKTAPSYIFLYLYEQINLSDIIGCEKVYANIIGIWKNYRTEFPRIDKYVAEWLTDFSLINKFRINLDDIAEILPNILNMVTIPEIYLPDNFFRDKSNAEMILENLSVYDYTKSKFYTEENKELFDRHIASILQAVLSSPEFEALVKKEADESAKLRTTRESYMGAVCVYEHKKRITVEYKNIYKSFYIRQCITNTIRCAENALRDYLGAKSKLALSAYPEQLAKAIEAYKAAYLNTAKPKGKKKHDTETAISAPPEFNPDISAAAEIEKDSWDTTLTLVELQNRDSEITTYYDTKEAEEASDDGEFIAIDTGNDEDIFDILDHLENPKNPELTDVGKFLESLDDLERTALLRLLDADANFDMICGEFLSQKGTMLESVIDALNEKAMDFIGDIVFDTATGKIIEDYKVQITEQKTYE